MAGGAQHHGGDVARRRAERERERLIDAFTRTAAECGYARTTVADITADAGLSRQAFDAHFSSKQQCMAAAYDAFAERLTEQISRSCDSEKPWPAQIKEAVGEGLEFLFETASRARLFAVEGMEAGPAVLERHFAFLGRLAELLRRGREDRPLAATLPEATEWMLMGGVANLVCAHLLAEERDALRNLEPVVVELVLSPYVGGVQARRMAIG